ncbi:MAG: deaminase [Acutalibacteraceae bacterium]|nr:deaminase [Acutalibacteraceae bacterium]
MSNAKRRDKANYYLDIAQTVSERGTCLRRKFGAIIVNDDEIVSTGYAGAPRGRQNCIDLGRCLRIENNIPRGERYEMCRSVHAEANCIISARRRDMIGASLYLACVDPVSGEVVPHTTSCSMCKRLIINAGIEKVYVRETADEYSVYTVSDWIENDESLGFNPGY